MVLPQSKTENGNACCSNIKNIARCRSFPSPNNKTKKRGTSPARPLFPGYFFARFDPVIHHRNVHFARGVSYVVRRNEIPVHVPAQVMMELRLISPNGILEIPDKPHCVGDKVKVIAGLFKGDEGIVTQLIPAKERELKYFLKF